jgi:uncharacterized protein
MHQIIIEKIRVNGIPLLTFAPEYAHRLPVVFFVHGFRGHKEQNVEVGYRLAESGFFAVLPDAEKHGERLAPPMNSLSSPDRTYVYPPGTGFDTFFVMCECALQTARDIDTLIAHFSADPRANTSRVGVSGFSMGGFTTYFAAANNPHITAVVPIGAYPALTIRWTDLVQEATSYEEWMNDMDRLHEEVARRLEWYRSIDPYEKMKDTFDRPLLMINGDVDVDSPKVYSIPLFAALRPRYRATGIGEKLRLRIVDGVAHQLTPEIASEMIAWFHKYLNGIEH